MPDQSAMKTARSRDFGSDSNFSNLSPTPTIVSDATLVGTVTITQESILDKVGE